MQRNTTYRTLFRNSPFFYLLQLLLIAFICGNCGVKKKLNYGDFLVVQNDIVFQEKKLKDEKKSTLEYELLTLARPKPNSKAVGLFRSGIWAYYKTNQPKDTTSLDRFMRKRWAEKPSLYTDEVALASAEAMMNFLNKKGYYQAKVRPEEALYPKKKTAKVSYHVRLGPRYYIDSIHYHSVDSLLQPIAYDLARSSLFIQGKPVSESLYYQEVQRITDTLRNNGYAYFHSNYIQQLESDSTGRKQQLNLDLIIRQPADEAHHQIYHIGDIQFYPSFFAQTFDAPTRDTIINGVTFRIPQGEDFRIDPQVLLKQLYLQKGQLYKQANFDKTNELLGNLGIFKFVNLKLVKHPTQPNVLDVVIYLTPSKQRSLGVEMELNNSFRSSINTTGQIFSLGGGANINYQNRNTFGGGELISMLLEGGAEVNFTDKVRINSVDFTARTDLVYPKFIDYMGLWRLTKKASLLTDNFYKDLHDKARSRISISYNHQDFINYYTFNTFNVSLGYNLTRTPNERAVFNQTGIDFFKSAIKDSFQIIVNNNPFLKRSLGDDQLFTGFLYRDLNYAWTSRTYKRGGSWQFRITNEISGLEMLGINALVNGLKTPLKINNISFAHYARFDADIRYHRDMKKNRTLALRFYSGIASPFGGITSDVPYVKQYYIGGPNSIRAWFVRELGPGTFHDPLVVEDFYQAGDFKMEFNAEYRFDLIPYILLEGAIFVDGGNIWTLREDAERPGSQLSSRFLNELALGGGVGFRFDFSFFIIRLDMGYKFRTPYLVGGENWQFNSYKDYTLIDFFRPTKVNYNLGIGYPF